MAEQRKLNFWRKSSGYRFVLLCLILAGTCLVLPLQKYFPLGRYQHYSLGVAIAGFGWLLQIIVAWPRVSTWGRICYLVTGLFFELVAFVLWCNPWLDYKVAVQTSEKEELRLQFIADYLMSTFLILLCWIKWWSKELKSRDTDVKDSGGSQA